MTRKRWRLIQCLISRNCSDAVYNIIHCSGEYLMVVSYVVRRTSEYLRTQARLYNIWKISVCLQIVKNFSISVTHLFFHLCMSLYIFFYRNCDTTLQREISCFDKKKNEQYVKASLISSWSLDSSILKDQNFLYAGVLFIFSGSASQTTWFSHW